MKLKESRKTGICFRSSSFIVDDKSVFIGLESFTFHFETTLSTYLTLI